MASTVDLSDNVGDDAFCLSEVEQSKDKNEACLSKSNTQCNQVERLRVEDRGPKGINDASERVDDGEPPVRCRYNCQGIYYWRGKHHHLNEKRKSVFDISIPHA